MKTGLDMLRAAPEQLRGRTVGVITNPTGYTHDLRHSTVETLATAPGCVLGAIFGPEHGLAGAAQDGIHVGHGRWRDVPVYSLYGNSPYGDTPYGDKLKPSAEALRGLDLLIFDIQDVGVRFYTYIYTLSYVMEAAAENGTEVMVLDRPNPLNGTEVEGPLLRSELASFIGRYSIPVRHGLTVGELAGYFAKRHVPGCNLTVQRMEGWQRGQYFDETRLPWIAPSPNLPTLDCAMIYPGLCLIEGTNLSEARGTTRPFECFGAPWMDGTALAHALNDLGLPGCVFRPISFEPRMSKHNGSLCHGAQIHVTDRAVLKPFATGLHVMDTLLALHPDQVRFLPASWEGRHPHFDLLTGDARIREALLRREPVTEIIAAYAADEARWRSEREAYFLY